MIFHKEMRGERTHKNACGEKIQQNDSFDAGLEHIHN